jgi:GWxTD domain-containing protein
VPLSFDKPGAYLMQSDTISPTGIPLLVLENYPKYSQVRYLAGPLIYICTKSEHEKLRNAGDDKKSFDRTILAIAGNAERARILMRSYFRRVEQANLQFTSYKEGWKTDRGMILIVYGLPDEVFRFKDREIWNYKNANFTGNFEFVRSGTLFDPDNYVLIRNPKYKEKWYEIVDLWRSAQF